MSVKTICSRGMVCAAILAAPQLGYAADREVRELLDEVKRLNQRVSELEAEQQERDTRESTGTLDAMTSDAPTPSVSRVGGPYQNSILSNTSVGGYASLEFEKFKGGDSTFDQHRFIVNVGSQLHERLKFYSEIEYEHGVVIETEGSASGTISIEDTNGNGVIDASEAENISADLDTDLGRSGEIAIEQAWMQYDVTPEFGLRAGVVLVPFGRFNLTHDDDLQVFTDRPLVARRVIPTTWQDAGAGFVFNKSLGDESRIFAEVYAMNGLNDEFNGGTDALREARSSMESDNNNNKAVAGRVAYSPLVGTEVGLSGYTGAYDDAGNGINAGAIDWDVNVGPFEFLGEAALFSVDDGVSKNGARAPKSLSGMLAELRYSFWFDELNETFLGKGFDAPKFVAAARYNKAEIERRGTLTNLDQDSYVLGLAYKPLPSFLIKTEYQFNDGDLERKNSDGFLTSMAIGF